MLLLVYAAVIVLCFVTFRSWRAVVVAVVPLVMTSILCEALMVRARHRRQGGDAAGDRARRRHRRRLRALPAERAAGAAARRRCRCAEAYARALRFTGKVVALVGVTLAAGVATWALSPIKFQADMGILLAFMFLWNMVGAVVLIPALSHFLLRSPAEAALRRPQPRAAGEGGLIVHH